MSWAAHRLNQEFADDLPQELRPFLSIERAPQRMQWLERHASCGLGGTRSSTDAMANLRRRHALAR
jgi:hypothetical protein